MKQTSIKGLASSTGLSAYLDEHSTLNPVKVNVMSSNPTGGNWRISF